MYLITAFAILFATMACAARGTAANSNATGNTAGRSESSATANPDRGEAVLDLDGGKVSVDYGRPALKGRDIMGLLSPGDEWRMGANSATTLTTDVDLKFGDKTVPKGKYVLTAKRVDKDNWQLIISDEDKSHVAEAPLAMEKTDDSVELMTINLTKQGNGGRFTLHWGTYALTTDFQKA